MKRATLLHLRAARRRVTDHARSEFGVYQSPGWDHGFTTRSDRLRAFSVRRDERRNLSGRHSQSSPERQLGRRAHGSCRHRQRRDDRVRLRGGHHHWAPDARRIRPFRLARSALPGARWSFAHRPAARRPSCALNRRCDLKPDIDHPVDSGHGRPGADVHVAARRRRTIVQVPVRAGGATMLCSATQIDDVLGFSKGALDSTRIAQSHRRRDPDQVLDSMSHRRRRRDALGLASE